MKNESFLGEERSRLSNILQLDLQAEMRSSFHFKWQDADGKPGVIYHCRLV
jgi:hypothetical protein